MIGWEPVTSPQHRPLRLDRARRHLPLLERTVSHARHVALAAESRPVDRRARPVHAVWELTLACDLGCRHCGSRAGKARPDELTRAEALELTRQLAALGVREVTLVGGEAYLYPAWTDVVRAVREHGMSCALVTGGRNFDRARAQAAHDAGVQSVSVSIDGDEATHDRLRRVAGSYHAARAALDHARAVGLSVALNTQINRINLHCLTHVCDLLFAHDCHGIQLILTVPAGRAADRPELVLQPYDLLELFPRLAALQERCVERGVKFLPGNNLGYFGPFEQQLRGALRCPSQSSCAAGRLVIGIEANGDIKGCPSLPTDGWVGGNVRDHALSDIWERSEPLRFTRDRDGSELWGFCAECYYAPECKAGCTWTATSLFGRPGNNPYCHHRALEHARRGLRERLVLVEEAPGDAFDHGIWAIVLESLHTTGESA
jgi:radical SAM protein with 4Fe4S-binding SPASM domain